MFHTVGRLELSDFEIQMKLKIRHGDVYISKYNDLELNMASYFRDDLEGAVEEFKRCTKVHKATPLQHELLCRLVVKVDAAVLEGDKVQTESKSGVQSERAADLLQQVLDACRRMHGGPSTHVTLAVVLAEQGMIKQLRHFLMVITCFSHFNFSLCTLLSIVPSFISFACSFFFPLLIFISEENLILYLCMVHLTLLLIALDSHD